MELDGIEFLKMLLNNRLIPTIFLFIVGLHLHSQSLYSVQLINNRVEKVSLIDIPNISSYSEVVWIDELRFASIATRKNSRQQDVMTFDLLSQNFQEVTNTPADEHGLIYYNNDLHFLVNQDESSLLYEVPTGRSVGRSMKIRLDSPDLDACVRLKDGTAICQDSRSRISLETVNGKSETIEQQMVLFVKPKEIFTANTNLPLFQIYEYPSKSSIYSFYITESGENLHYHNGKLFSAAGKKIQSVDSQNKKAVFADLTDYLGNKSIIDFELSPSGNKVLIIAQ